MSNDFVKVLCKNIMEVWNLVTGAISHRVQCNSTWNTYFLSSSPLVCLPYNCDAYVPNVCFSKFSFCKQGRDYNEQGMVPSVSFLPATSVSHLKQNY